MSGDNWRLVWSDEFDGANGSPPDPGKWGYDIGGSGWGNNEKQNYTDSTKNAYLDGTGHLVIKAIRENSNGMPYSSARLVSTNKGDWTYGKFEARAKLPRGKGMWPAIWMLPTDWKYGAWPISGEIDIMEQRGSDPLKVMGTIHFGNPWKYIGSSYTLPDEGYHVYAVEWEPNEIRWYVDGNLYQTRQASEWYSSGGPSPAPFNQRFHFLLNLAVGGNFDGDPDGSTSFPQTMTIDYVRAYARDGSAGTPESVTLPAKIEAEKFSAMNGVQLETTTDAGGGQNVGWIDAGDWMEYKVNVPAAGVYTVQYRVASQGTTGQIQLKSGSAVLATTSVPNTGGWQNWQTISATASLSAGQSTLRVHASGAGFNLNWLSFARPQVQNLLTNPDFETGDLSGWFEWHNHALAHKVDKDQPYSGSYKLTHWASTGYQQITAQKVNVPNGLYKASVWARSGGGQIALKLYAKDYGGAELSANIGTSPVTNYTQYTINNIQVTNGQIEVGIWHDANANNWAAFDHFELALQ
ncbi:carbohydrate-binding protein [Paenibacillus glycinis]|uniref:Carbohydrate-binding protein n=1 Tax=Paenibacillus glycinis TaxID=2697035 RepID=A0ABW9XQ91_9BACL|nr:carbohydrate-binding protein [Paenibacillus glycinis]NBD24810.1 carbohydrate-binding protein [Paenibacillus glycinis]